MEKQATQMICQGFSDDQPKLSLNLLGMEVYEELLSQIQQSIDESEVAIATVVDCFLKVYSAASILNLSEELNPTNRILTEQICQEVPKVISALQFQDRLKQRLAFIRSIVCNDGDSSSFEPGIVSRKPDEGVYLDYRKNPLSGQVEDGDVTFFSEAA